MFDNGLCSECQGKVPMMDFDKAVEVIKGVINLQMYIELGESVESPLPTSFILDGIKTCAKIAHEAIGSGMIKDSKGE